MLTKGTAPNAVKTAFDVLVKEEFDYNVAPNLATARTSPVFMQESIDRDAIITEQRSGSGYLTKRGEQADVAQGTVRVGNQQVFTVEEFSQSIPISRWFYNDDQHYVVERTMKDAGRLLRLTQDKEAMAVYAGGFATEKTNDGDYIFYDSHSTLDGVTVDNLETGVLNATNLNTLFISLTRQKTQDGTRGAHEPAFLLVPKTLHKTAMEITESDLKPGSANNDINYYSAVYPGLVVYSNLFLDDDSTTAYFLGGRSHTMTRWVREASFSSLVNWDIQANLDYKYVFGYREIVGCPSWEGLIASSGTV